MKINLVLDPPFEVHQRAGIEWVETVNADGDIHKHPEGGCDYIHVTVECADQAGIDYLVSLLDREIVSKEEIP